MSFDVRGRKSLRSAFVGFVIAFRRMLLVAQVRSLAAALLLVISGGAWADYGEFCVAEEQGPPDPLVEVTEGFCYLCGYGYVEVEITNPYSPGTFATGDQPYLTRTVEECYNPPGPGGDICVDATQSRRNPDYGSQNPALSFSGLNDLVITLTDGLEHYPNVPATIPVGATVVASGSTINIRNMSDLQPGQTRTVRVPVHRPDDREGLHDTSPTATASINYSMADNCDDDPGRSYNGRDNGWYDNYTCTSTSCTGDLDNPPTDFWANYGPPGTIDSGSVEVFQPEIDLNKQGWNYDSGQRENTRSDLVYGHNDDDIVWRINIDNDGDADLQDLRVDDVLSRADIMNANYVCPTAAAANDVALNNGALPGGSPCVPTDSATGTVLQNFVVSPPFGAGQTVNDQSPVYVDNGGDIADIRNGPSINLYVVGKIQSDGACTNEELVNEINDVEFGCEAQSGAGGIDSGEDETARLNAHYGLGGGNNALRVERQLTGVTGTGPVGMRGLMTITLRNEGRGTVWFDPSMAYHLRDELPNEYVVDPSFTPIIENAYSLYSGYPGRVDQLEWVNRQGASPTSTTDTTGYLNNSEPEFKLTSSTTDQDPDQAEESTGLMRHGDVIVIRFAVVMKDSEYFDRAADLDVQEEDPSTSLFQRPGELTDPNLNSFSGFDNTLEMRIKTLCDTQGVLQSTMTGNGENNSFATSDDGTPVTFSPEELDVSINEPAFIITNDPGQTTPLSVTLTNRGGDEARDFRVFVSFGATINVVSDNPPLGFSCGQISITPTSVDGNGRPMGHPDPYKVWAVNPTPDDIDNMHMLLPADGTVYQCQPTGAPFNAALGTGPGVTFEFEVNKSTNQSDIDADDLTFRADVVGEIFTLSDFTIDGTDVDDNTVNPNQVNNGGNRSITDVTVNDPTAIANGDPLWFPAPGSAGNTRSDGEVDRGNLYSLDTHWSRGIGFNLRKDQVTAGDTSSGNFGGQPNLGHCNENIGEVSQAAANTFPGQTKPAEHVQIGEECTVRIQTGGWFGFDSRGFNFIGVRDIQVLDQIPNGQSYISSTVPLVTPQIAGATQAPNDPITTPMGEVSPFGWRFTGNEDSGQPSAPNEGNYVVDIDQWFTINATSRLLNKMQNDRAVPNVHGNNSANVLDSSFTGVFYNNNTGLWEEPTFGSHSGGTTVGYPREPIRRVDVVITEPLIEVVKEICEVSDFNVATGTCGAGWTADYQGAVTTSDYIYRLTVSNENAADGHPRTPAYDLTVEDTLPDLLRIVDLDTDGIDNDGDGDVDEPGEEGVIVGNVMNDGNPTTITFSHTQGVDGTGLRRLEPGASLHLYYRVDPDDRIAPSETLTNTVVVTYYDSLEGSGNDHGNQTVVMQVSGELGGARTYPAPGDENTAAEASLTFIEPTTEPKTITGLSQTPLAGSGTQQVKIGEEIEYTLTAELPVNQLRNLTVTDELQAGLFCADAPTIDLSNDAPWNAAGFKRPDGTDVGDVTPICTDNQVQWAFGDVVLSNPSPDRDPNRFTFQLTFIAGVLNSSANNDAVTLSNGEPATAATLEWVDQSGDPHSLDYGQVDVQITEPVIALTKTFDVTEADAADIITVTVTATNTGSAAAYNLRVLDNLVGTKLTYIGEISGTDPPNNDANGETTNAPVFSWDRASNPNYAIAPGEVKTFTFQVQADNDVEPHEILTNSIQAAWQSLPGRDVALNSNNQIGENGAADGMRNGQLPGETDPQPGNINDYETVEIPVDEPAVVPAVTITKTDLNPAITQLPVGAHKQFEIEIQLPEGITQNVVVTDNLDAAGVSYALTHNDLFDIEYEFVGIELINDTAPTSDNAETIFNSFPGEGTDTAGQISWDIGQVDTESDTAENPVNPVIRIRYFARVNNVDAVQEDTSLQNAAAVNYTNVETGQPVSDTDDTPAISVIEPDLQIAKQWTDTTGDTLFAVGGDVLEYTITVSHTTDSDADAFDLNLFDDLPPELMYVAGSGSIQIGGNPPVAIEPTTDANGDLIWGKGQGDNSLDLPHGQQLVLVYRAEVRGVFGTEIVNSVVADWTSLQDADDGSDFDERHGDGCPIITAPNDYCTDPPAVLSVPTEDNTGIEKSVAEDTDTETPVGELRVGDIVTYTLQLNLQPGTTPNVSVVDTLPVGLEFVEIVAINGASSAPYGAGNGYNYANIPASAVPSQGQTGVVTWTLGDIEREFGTLTPFIIQYRARVVEDTLTHEPTTQQLVNTAVLSYGSNNAQDTAQINVMQPLIDQLTKTDRGGKTSPYTVVDLLNDTMQFRLHACNSGDAPAYNLQLTDDLAPQMDQASIENLVVSIGGSPLIENNDYSYTPPANLGEDMLFTFNVPVGPGQCLDIDYDIGFHTTVGSAEIWFNTFAVDQYWSMPDSSGQQYAPVALPIPFQMQTGSAVTEPLLKELIAPADGTASIGEEVRYRITVPQNPVTSSSLTGVVVTDILDGLGDIMLFESATLNGDPIDPASPTDLTFDVGVITAGTTAVLEIVAHVADSANAIAGTDINNSADYTYLEGGNPLPGGGNSVEFTIVEPELVMDKTGPAGDTVQAGLPGRFTLDVHNTGLGEAWDITLSDLLPNVAQGGMCETPPQNFTAEILDDGGITQATLTEGTDFTTTYDAVACLLTVSTSGANAMIPADHHLVLSYDAYLDADTQDGSGLTNIAGATLWHSLESSSSDQVREYVRTLTDGTPALADHEDAYTITAAVPSFEFRKTVINVTSGQDPGINAIPGDRLRYSVSLRNLSSFEVNDIALTDELDALNASPMFVPGSLTLITTPLGGDTSNTNPNGGAAGTGLVDVRNLNLDAAGGASDSLVVEFEITLAAVIDNGTLVLNQAQMQPPGMPAFVSDDPIENGPDDPEVQGDEDPTQTYITSAPDFRVEKISDDITGDANILLAGDTLRYTITIKNIGNENAVDVALRDQIPANTTYVPNSTTLNGAAVADAGGVSPLSAGMPINAPEDITAGVMRADMDEAANNVATITFDVTINQVNDGTVISNQGFVGGEGAGSGGFAEQPSDDPATPQADDPTIDIVGAVPLLNVQKTVDIFEDNLTPGIVDPGDVLRYTITVANMGGVDATNTVLTDQVPADTTYEAGSTQLNGILVPDNAGGITRLDTGLPISSADLTPPLPGNGEGVITSAQTATIIFDVRVNAGTPTGTVISNQGNVETEELPLVLTDADGNASNGAQPTQVVVGDAQQLNIIKEVAVVGGGAALPGATLEYLVRVTNISGVPATLVQITDDLLSAGDGVLTYIDGSAQLNGLPTGVVVNGSLITADYSTNYGDLQPGGEILLRFQAMLDQDLAIGFTVTNTAQVQWNDPPVYNEASVSVDVGGTPGIANLNGYLWHDVNFNEVVDTQEPLLAGWTVELYFDDTFLDSVPADENGYFQFTGLVPNLGTNSNYELRYLAPNASETTASLGNASSDFTNGPQRISEIMVGYGANPQNLNLPLTPNGAVYNSVVRQPINGARLTLLRASSGMALPEDCFDDPKQQNQITLFGGYYKFDINFSRAECAANADYLIDVQAPGDDYVVGNSLIIPPQTHVDSAAFDVPACLGNTADLIPATPEHCEVQLSAQTPPIDADPRSPETHYYLKLNLDDNRIPGESQLFNNHIPLDPQLDGAVSITKTAALLNVTRSQLVPYTITFSNTLPVPLTQLQLVDFFPAGFKYVAGSARVDGEAIEPQVDGLQLLWPDLRVEPDQTRTVKLLLVVGSGVGEGKYVNRARMFNLLSGQAASGEASATVRVIPDPTFDCSDVIGKVYNDKNMNGYQDQGEGGVPGARVVTATGLNATTDPHGRFHITCAVVPNQDRGSNFILKLDDRSLPSGYRMTTENPRVVRATRGKAIKVNFGSSLHRVVRLDMAEAVFEPETTELRPQWTSRTELLLEKLQEAPSVLRLSYLAENENPDLVEKRLQAVKAQIARDWANEYGDYELTIETEVFWRRGAPPVKGGLE